MKTPITILVAIMLFGITTLQAEQKNSTKEASTTLTTSISGTITDAQTGESLAGVKVVLQELNTVVYTDFDGRFEFSKVAKGTYTVSTDYVSYKTEQSLSVDTSKSSDLSIALKADL